MLITTTPEDDGITLTKLRELDESFAARIAEDRGRTGSLTATEIQDSFVQLAVIAFEFMKHAKTPDGFAAPPGELRQ